MCYCPFNVCWMPIILLEPASAVSFLTLESPICTPPLEDVLEQELYCEQCLIILDIILCLQLGCCRKRTEITAHTPPKIAAQQQHGEAEPKHGPALQWLLGEEKRAQPSRQQMVLWDFWAPSTISCFEKLITCSMARCVPTSEMWQPCQNVGMQGGQCGLAWGNSPPSMLQEVGQSWVLAPYRIKERVIHAGRDLFLLRD